MNIVVHNNIVSANIISQNLANGRLMTTSNRNLPYSWCDFFFLAHLYKKQNKNTIYKILFLNNIFSHCRNKITPSTTYIILIILSNVCVLIIWLLLFPLALLAECYVLLHVAAKLYMLVITHSSP